MTGREIIIYILKNNLENSDFSLFNKSNLEKWGFVAIDKAASDFSVGPATVSAWCARKFLDYVLLDGETYIVKNEKYEEVKSWEEI